MTRKHAAASSTLALGLLALFLLGLTGAALVYPGGSWADSSTPGFDPLVNYWCDLMRADGIDGSPNRTGSVLAKGAFCALALSLATLFRAAAPLLRSERLARLAARGGALTALLVVLVALVAYEDHRYFHAGAALLSGCIGFATTVLVIVASWRSEPLRTWRRTAGVLVLAAAATNLVVYADAVARQADSTVLPVVQKVATAFFALWVVVMALAIRRVSIAEDPGTLEGGGLR